MRLAALASMVVLAPGATRGCADTPSAPLEVRWTFPEGPGDRGVRFVGCMDWDLDALPDGQAGIEAQAGWTSCGVVGWRRDGQLLVRTEPVPLDGSIRQEITFDLPEGPIGGMGATVEAIGAGILVHAVVPGSPADGAGMVPGDLITAVNGNPTDRLSTAAFVRQATGMPGSPVSVRIRHDGEEYAVGMFRERIP